jgi:cysteinyl-tRNA synthetase
MLDFAAGLAVVLGRGGVSWLRDGSTTRLDAGASMPLAALGVMRHPESMEDIPQAVWDAACRTDLSISPKQEPPEPVRALVMARAQARANGDWGLSDQLRLEIAAAGWHVRDTPEGPLVVHD